MSDKKEKPREVELDKLSALKEIILGADKAEFEERFELLEQKLSSGLDKTQRGLISKMEKMESSLIEKISLLKENSRKMDATLKEDKADRQLLGDLLIRLGKDLKK